MTKETQLWVATMAASKNYDYEKTLKCGYVDDDFMDEIWKYVIECKEIGKQLFYEKYKEFQLYGN